LADQNPRGFLAPSFDTSLSETILPETTLVEDLAEVADDIRQIATDLGARPYTVHAIRVRWEGGEVGRGEPVPSFEVQLLPTPKLSGISSFDRYNAEAGAVERGDMVLTGVSPRYSESDIDTMFGVDAGPDEECFVEVRIDQRDGNTIRRRFALAKPPERRPTMCDWRVSIRRHSGDRQVDGTRRPERQERWR